MELSAFSVVDAFPTEVRGDRDRYAEALSLVQAADRAELSCFWVAEHHFHPGGLVPDPAVFLAAAGARTRRIRLGCMVSVLPFHRPIDVAESYALLDELLQGRLNFGAGSGYIPEELAGFGVDPSTKREAFDAGLATVLAAFRGEPVPGPGGAPVHLNVRSRQRPNPPVWIASQRREALPHIAARGLSVALIPYATVGSVAELATEIGEYRRAVPSGARTKVSAALHVYAGDQPERARAALQRYLDGRRSTHTSAHYAAKVARDPQAASVDAIEKSGLAVLGRPAEVIERLWAFEEAGVDEVLGIFDFGGLAEKDVLGSVEALGRAWPS